MKEDSQGPDARRPQVNRPQLSAKQGQDGSRESVQDATESSAGANPSLPNEPPINWSDPAPMQIMLEMRKKRRRRLLVAIGLFCGLPTLLVFFYMLLIASPRYVSELEITYQTFQPPQTLSTGLVQTVLGTSAGSTVDLSTILYEYIRSPSLLNTLDEQLQIRKYYSASNIDYLSRLGSNASIDNALRYFHWYVSVSQGNGGYLTITVQTFDPKYAVELAGAITKACDQMLEQMTSRARQDQVRSAQVFVKQAQDDVSKARLALADFQNKHGNLNPQNSANQLGGIAGTMESDLAATRAALTNLQSVAPNSPQVSATKTQIAALEGQLKNTQHRLANNSGDSSNSAETIYSNLLNEYSALQLQQDFAKAAFLSAQQGLAVAMADAASKQNYLIDFAPAYIPGNVTLEIALTYALTTFLTTLGLYGIISLLGGAVRDQSAM